MKKNIIILFLSIFMLLMLSSSVIATDTDNITTDSSNTIVVDGSSRNQMNNPTIQDAIDSANAGDTINITGLSYEHCHFVVDKQLTIISEVKTSLDPCSSNAQGSNGIGIFYFTENASGSVLSGFTFTNYQIRTPVNTVNPYAVYVNGADNITVADCNIKNVDYGNGILINNTNNIKIDGITIKKAINGIVLDNSNNTIISRSNITSNSKEGISILDNCYNFLIKDNNISKNSEIGIYVGSAFNSTILNNIIGNNQKLSVGTGIYLDSPIISFKIIGNYIHDNGKYGIFTSSEAMGTLVDETVDIIDQNIFHGHSSRAVYAEDNYGCSATIYVASNFYGGELICPSTAYEPNYLVVANNNPRDLILSNISEVSPGVYNVSVIKKHNGEIANDLSSIELTFFLNKNSTKASIESGDIAKTVRVINGTATVDFSDETFKSTGNMLTAVGPGVGKIDLRPASGRLCQEYSISDRSLPNVEAAPAKLIASDLKAYYGSNPYFRAQLVDGNGTPIKDEHVNFILNGQLYQRVTNENGEISIRIGLNSNKYTIITTYCGSKVYECDNLQNTITILPTVDSRDLVKVYRNDTQYEAKFLTTDGKAIANTNVTFNINGVQYTRLTDERGVAKLNINLHADDYIITALNPITNEQISNSIRVLSTIDENRDIVKYYRNDTQYSVRLIGNDGKYVKAGEEVTFNINGLLYTRTTDENGYATLNINLQPGDYIITGEYHGARISNNIKVLPILKANNLTKTAGTAKQFQVELINGQGEAYANQTIIFNINGVFYNRTTANNGIASLNINLQAGEYIITSSYNQANIANKVTIT